MNKKKLLEQAFSKGFLVGSIVQTAFNVVFTEILMFKFNK